MYSYLIFWRPLLVAILFFCFGVSYADTYSATLKYYDHLGNHLSYPDESCTDHSDSTYSYYLDSSDILLLKCMRLHNTLGILSVAYTYGGLYSCPYGGTVSGSNCINVIACVAPQMRNPITGQCQIPADCSELGYTLNPNTNTCIKVTCPDGQMYLSSPSNPVGGCYPLPAACPVGGLICSTVEQYCGNENGSIAVTPVCPLPPTCPTGSHLAPDSKTCAKDIQLACPVGQHASLDNASCIADDPKACPPGTRPGTINGVTTCQQSGSIDAPDGVIPVKNTATATTTNGVQTTTAITVANPDGSTTTQSTTTQAPSETKMTFDTTGLAQDSSLKTINDSINKPSSKTAFSSNAPGAAPADTMLAQIDGKKLELQALMTNIKGQFNGMTPTFSGGSGISCGSGIHISSLNININFCPDEQLAQYLPLIGNAIYFLAAFAALVILLA
ncbi:hypothetical protein [Methylobacter tundripaludum]|nr:hypothetical protein [Methylobacter tundripaludum]